MWICQNESAVFWKSVLTNLRARVVEDILITSTGNLKGFVDAIKSVYLRKNSGLHSSSTKELTKICGLERQEAVHYCFMRDL